MRAAIRAAAMAIAAFALSHVAMPAQAQNRQTTAGAPLQLLPGAGQATRTVKAKRTPAAVSRSATKKTAKSKAKPATSVTTTRISRAKAERNGRTATATASRRNRTPVRAVRSRPAQRAIAAAVPEIQQQDTAGPLAFAPMPSQRAVQPRTSPNEASKKQEPRDNVMRGGDSVSLIGRLPWWRNNALQPIRYGSEEAQSQVLAAADAWLVATGTAVADAVLTGDIEPESIVIADAGEFNAIDRALASVQVPSSPAFWHSLVAILGGAVAAAAVAAATARLMFA